MAINEKATVEVQVNGEQAKQELRSLESYATSLKGRLAEAYKAGDTKQIKKLESELRKTNTELKTMRTNAKNIDVAMNNIGLATPKELRQLLRDINSKLNSGNIKRGSAEWKKYQAQLKLVNTEIRKVNAEVRETQGWLTRFNNGFSKWGALAGSAVAAITGVSFALSKLRNNRDDKEESADNLKALTGLDDDSIKWLTKQAEILSTAMDKTGLRVTQSSKDILEAYMLVGSAKPELLKDKNALNSVTIEAMRLASAAKMNLKEAVDAVTISLNQYGDGADQAAKVTNVLAAGSKYGAANVVSQASAIVKAGVSAAGANVPLEQLVGTIEMLGEKGIKDEIAGTGLKKFFLVLQTGAKDTNPAVVGLNKVLENLQKKNLSAGALKKMFGEEGYNVAKVLIDNTAKVKEYTKAVTGTGVAIEQAAINSDNSKAKRAQYINQIREAGIILMDKLNPSLSALTGWTTKLIRMTPELIDWIKEYGRVVAYAVIVVGSYIAAEKLHAFWIKKVKTETGQYIVVEQLKQFWDKAVTASTWLYIAATSALTGKLAQARLAMQAFFLVIKGFPLAWVVSAVVAVSGAIYLLATRTWKAKTVTEEFFSSIAEERNELNKIYGQLLKTNEKTAERTRLINEFNNHFGKYLTNLLNEKSTVDDIKKAYKEATTAMNDHYARELLASKESEIVKKNIDEQSKALQSSLDTAVNATKEQKARLSQLVNDVTNQVLTDNPDYGIGNVKQKIYEQINKDFGSGAAYDLFGGSQGWEKFSEQINPFIKGAEKTIQKVNKLKEELSPFMKELSGVSPESSDNEAKKLAEEKRYEAELKKLKERYLKSNKMSQEEYANESDQLELKHLNNQLAIAGLEPEERKRIADKILEIEIRAKSQMGHILNKAKQLAEEKRYEAELKQLKEQYLKSDKMSREEYANEAEKLELKHLNNQLAIAGLEPKERKKIEDKILEIKIRTKNKLGQILSELDKSATDARQKELDDLKQKEASELAVFKQARDENLLSEEDYQKKIAEVKKRYADKADKLKDKTTKAEKREIEEEYKQKVADIIRNAYDSKASPVDFKNYFSSLLSGVDELESVLSNISPDSASYDSIANYVKELKDYIKKEFDDIVDFLENDISVEIGNALGDAFTGNYESMRDSLKSVLQMVLDYLEKMMMASIAAVTLQSFITNPLAALASLGKIMAIKAAFAVAKTSIGNFYTGGFTGPGQWDEPRGMVHSNEFVANRFAVSNPSLMPVLKLIDTAQKNNTVGSLTSRDVSNALHGGSTGVKAEKTNIDVVQAVDPETKALIAECTQVMQTVKKRFDQPIVAESYVTGKRGVNKALDEYSRLIKNVQR